MSNYTIEIYRPERDLWYLLEGGYSSEAAAQRQIDAWGKQVAGRPLRIGEVEKK